MLKSTIFCAFAALALAACGSKDAPAANNAAATTTTTAATPKPKEPLKIALDVRSLPEDTTTGTPYAEIYFTFSSDNKKGEFRIGQTFMGAPNVFTAEEIAADTQFGIPKEAKLAASTFWAGLGECVYVIEKEGKYVIYRGVQDEGMPKYEYKEEKVVDPNKLIY